MAIKIEMLRCFDAVVQQGNLGSAADALGRTPSAVSMMLKQFEDHIGTPLFETSRKSRLTALGELIHIETVRELKHFSKTVAKIESFSKAELGAVSIVVPPSLAISILPTVIAKFTAENPRISIEVRDMNSVSVLRELSADRADIGMSSIPPSNDFFSTRLFSDPFGVVCRKDHPLAKAGNALKWSDVKGSRFILNDLCNFIKNDEFEKIKNTSRLHVPNTASLIGMIHAGLGITILPRLALSTMSSELVFLPLFDQEARRDVYLVTKPIRSLTPVVAKLAKEFENIEFNLTE